MLKITRKPKQVEETVEKTEEEMKMNKWSLKKKVLLGVGVLATAAVGVFAYGQLKPEEEFDYTEQDSEGTSHDYDDKEELQRDLNELEAMEKAEEAQE